MEAEVYARAIFPSYTRAMIRHIEKLFIDKGAAVQAFFRRRLRPGSGLDALDLTQEVYSRMLNASRQREIRDPEAYLFTVARHLLEEQAVAARRHSMNVELSDPVAVAALSAETTVERDVDGARLTEVLREGMGGLSPPCQAAVVLAYQEGLSYREIAEHLGVSKPMVQKYLAQAISQCRRRLLRYERSGRHPGEKT